MWTLRRSLAFVCGVSALALLVTSARARLVYELTDPELAGPEQPIRFSHKVHAGLLQMDCKYCHSGADRGPHATIPSVGLCMGCHQWVKQGATEGSVEEIALLAGYYERGEAIPWIRIHNLPEHVQFDHQRHVLVNIACEQCHGLVNEMNRIYQVADTRYHPSSAFLPAAKLEMGWCMTCHREQKGPRECVLCHY